MIQQLKYGIVVVLLFFTVLPAFAQSSIANPNFEILTTAGQYPTTISQMNRAASWIQPTDGTCDYFYGSPNPSPFRMTIGGTTINAQNGAAYAGGFVELTNGTTTNYKEYITNKLSSKLIAGVTYSITFYTMHLYGTSTTSGFTIWPFADLPAANQGALGFCFSDVAPTTANTATTGNGGQLSGGILNSWNPTKRALIPASNTTVYGTGSRNTWVPVTLTYTADGTEEYMTLGQWREGTSGLPASTAAYYLYDNLSPTLIPIAGLSKSVSPTTITDGGTATYTFTINNNASGSTSQSGIGFIDALPSSLRVAATPNVVVTGLTGGSVTATAGGTSIAVSGYTIAANTTATIAVNVTNVLGQTNTSCASNPSGFTNSSTNMSGLSSNLANNVSNVCLVVTPCNAGITAPPMAGSTLSNVCPATTANLNNLHNGTTPSGATLVWFTDNAHTGTAYSTPTAATAGTYYAFYYDSTNSCYSPASAAVTVTINACSKTVSNVCPTATVNLNSLQSGTIPNGSSLVWFTNNAHTGTAYATPTAATAGTYYAFFYDSSYGGCYSPASIPVTVTTTPCYCTQPGVFNAAGEVSMTGISYLAGFANGWPKNVPNGYIVMESRNSGFVITRVNSSSDIAAPVEGMLVYDITSACVKLYNGTTWHCLARTCNQ